MEHRVRLNIPKIFSHYLILFCLFSKMQCDLQLNVDCTEYELYYFPDGEDVRVYESLHGNNEIESPSSLSKAKTAFCLYMDG